MANFLAFENFSWKFGNSVIFCGCWLWLLFLLVKSFNRITVHESWPYHAGDVLELLVTLDCNLDL